tara:strand:+ start:2203 stop:3372 length:1170 start_codon:yes stop_codon:yes gene_type:complete
MDQDAGLYLTAKQAAEELGINLQTLYAYVSRKNLRSVKVDTSRSRLYWASDIARLKAQRKSHKDNNINSAITLLTDDAIYYRGIDVRELAPVATLENIADLLWCSNATAAKSNINIPDWLIDYEIRISIHERMDQAISTLPLIGSSNPSNFDFSPENYAFTGAAAIRAFVHILFHSDINNEKSIHEIIGDKIGCSDKNKDLIRQLLVLSADHEIDHITHAVRAAASTGTNPYDLITVALLSGRGVRIKRLRIEATETFLMEIVRSGDISSLINRYLKNGEGLPGFNHISHSKHDPRAAFILDSMMTIYNDDIEFNRLFQLISLAKKQNIGNPDFLLVAMFLNYKIGSSFHVLSILAIGRSVGWIAHGMEQFHGGNFVRKRANYVGELPK